MRYLRPNVSERDTGVLAAWGEQVAMASKMPSLSRLFVQCGDELFPRFAASYEELRTLPRRTRRALQRRLARSRDLTRLAKDGMPAHGGRALRHKLAWSLAGAALLLALWQNADAAIYHGQYDQAQYRPGRWEMFTDRSDHCREHRCKF